MVLKHSVKTIFSAVVWEWCKNVWYSNSTQMQNAVIAVWEWCKNVWYSNSRYIEPDVVQFENDVKMYGTQTMLEEVNVPVEFENDVKMYGTQTCFRKIPI